jgi:hypothetical protein
VLIGESYFSKKPINTRPAWIKNSLRSYELLKKREGKEAADISFADFMKEYELWKVSNAVSKGQRVNLLPTQGSLRKAKRKSKKSRKTARKQRK